MCSLYPSRRTTKFDVVTHVGVSGRGVYLGVSYASHPKRTERSPIWGFSRIFAYTLQCRTTKFGMVTHMGIGERRVLRHLHKCVARFVSDIWVSFLVSYREHQRNFTNGAYAIHRFRQVLVRLSTTNPE